jgi:hypothetical protein
MAEGLCRKSGGLNRWGRPRDFDDGRHYDPATYTTYTEVSMKPATRAIAKALIVFLLVSIAFAAGWYARGRDQVRRLSPAEFVNRERLIGSIQGANFLGVAYGRAYLLEWSYWPIIGIRTRLLWTEASRLSPEVLRELEAKEAQAAQAAAPKSRYPAP